MSKETEQAKLLRAARTRLGITSEELADRLGVELGTLRQWMLPEGAKARRNMTRTAVLLLERILSAQRKPRK